VIEYNDPSHKTNPEGALAAANMMTEPGERATLGDTGGYGAPLIDTRPVMAGMDAPEPVRVIDRAVILSPTVRL
jgi:hypothetical protein